MEDKCKRCRKTLYDTYDEPKEGLKEVFNIKGEYCACPDQEQQRIRYWKGQIAKVKEGKLPKMFHYSQQEKEEMIRIYKEKIAGLKKTKVLA